MPIIVPKRLPLWNRERTLILFVIILILSLLIVFITLTEMQRAKMERERPSFVLQGALQGMNNNYGMLGVQIMEEGDGHVLNFNGRMLGEKTVSGEIEEYELEVYLNRNGDLYIKDLIDGVWKHAADLGLETLKEFLKMPFGLLEQNCDNFNEARFVSNNEKDHVIMLHLPVDQFIPYFAALEESRLDCLLFIEEDSLFIYQISFSLYGNSDNKEILKRTFIFDDLDLQDQRNNKYDGDEKTRIAAGE